VAYSRSRGKFLLPLAGVDERSWSWIDGFQVSLPDVSRRARRLVSSFSREVGSGCCALSLIISTVIICGDLELSFIGETHQQRGGPGGAARFLCLADP